LRREFGAEPYDEDQLARALENYIPPLCTNVDPAGAEDLRLVVPFKNPLFEIVDDFLATDRTEKHVLVLADSGMGKTSFLLNYYARNRRKRRGQQVRIAVVPLGRPDVLERIERIENKRSTVLFLDAFDEDTRAIEDHRTRLGELMDCCSDFRRVLITCRTQFFQSDEEIPRETGVAIITPRKGGESGSYKFYKIYLAPFTAAMVQRYIRTRFPLTQWRRRREAFALVESIPELALRPMLLAVVPDLVLKHKGVRNISDVYAFMIQSWLDRESSWISVPILRELSRRIAVNIFLLRGERGHEVIPRSDLSQLLDSEAPTLDKWRLTARSLLNRDAAGNLKFAHRSIMEYLFVREFLEGNELCALVEWTDLMKEFLVTSLTTEPELVRSMPTVSAEDLRVTGFFPIADIERRPHRLSKREALRFQTAPPADGVALGLWQRVLDLRGAQSGWMRAESRATGVRVLDDYASGSTWMFVVDSAAESVDAIELTDPVTAAENRKELNRAGFGSRFDWQLPTLAQFDYLATAMDWRRFVVKDLLYWSSDTSTDGNALAVSFGEAPLEMQDMTLLGKRELGPQSKGGFFVYEMRLSRPKSIDKYPVGACIWIATKDVTRVQREFQTDTERVEWTQYLRRALRRMPKARQSHVSEGGDYEGDR
jgi:hypothetical protein